MANKSTKSTQTSVRMAQHNERTRLHELLCTPTQATRALVMQPCCVEPSALVCVLFVDLLAIPTPSNIVNVFVSCSFTFCWLIIYIFCVYCW